MTFGLLLLTGFLLLIYIPAFGMLLVYSLNLYYLCILAFWRQRKASRIAASGEFPAVTVQIPLYNERYVSRRIIDAVARLEWPRERLYIQILDDSTDETREMVAEAVAYWVEQGVHIEQIRRPNRDGYKAGALAYGLTKTDSDYIAIFDADFVPSTDFLKQTIPQLAAEPRAAFVQARWDHLNRGDSWLTRIQAIAIDGHFAIEQFARYHGGYAFNFNGTAGVWRRAAIEDAGGWKDNTLTEDLDLSYRAWLRGWRGLYRRDVASPAELPPTMTAFRRQQARWAQGSIECARMLLPPIWRSEYPVLAKVQATIHLLGYLVNPIMAVLMLCYPLMLVIVSRVPEAETLFGLVSTVGPMTIAPTIFFLAAQVFLRRPEWQSLVAVALYQLIGAGMAMNTLRATLKAVIGQRGEFLRTPKWGNTALGASSYRIKADLGVLIDLLWGLVCLLIGLLALQNGHYFMVIYGFISCVGSWWVAAWTMWPEFRAAWSARRGPLVMEPGKGA